MVHDTLRSRIVLHGGQPWHVAAAAYDDTWSHDGADWHLLTSGTLPWVEGTRIAYDIVHDRIVRFGGWHMGFTGDTWSFDGASWSQTMPATVPPTRIRHLMAYDSQRARVVMFGGLHDWGNTLGDTWEWDGTDWIAIQPATSPPGRSASAMVYDSGRGRCVLFGGWGATATLGDTWEWDGVDWTMAAPTVSPPPRGSFALAYDSGRARTVLFGGYGAQGLLGDTWEWDGTDWVQWITPVAPTARTGPTMCYDPIRGVTVLFAGDDGGPVGLNDTWEWHGPLQTLTASAHSYGTGCGSPPLRLTPALGTRPLLGSIQIVDLTNLPSNPAFLALGFSNTLVGATPLPMSLDPYGLTGCLLLQDCQLSFMESCSPTGPTTAQRVLAVPNNAVLMGLAVYLQGWSNAPGLNPAGIAVSNGLFLLVGNR